jgi:hypothetical protein
MQCFAFEEVSLQLQVHPTKQVREPWVRAQGIPTRVNFEGDTCKAKRVSLVTFFQTFARLLPITLKK